MKTEIFLRCDEKADDLACLTRFPYDGRNFSDTDDALDLLIRLAREDGWEVTVKDFGLKGRTVSCVCPSDLHKPDDGVDHD